MLPSVSFATRNKQKPPGSARPVRRREWDPEEELGRPETTRMAGYTRHQMLAAPARPGMRRRAHGEMGPGAWGAVWFPEGAHRRGGEGGSHTRTHTPADAGPLFSPSLRPSVCVTSRDAPHAQPRNTHKAQRGRHQHRTKPNQPPKAGYFSMAPGTRNTAG